MGKRKSKGNLEISTRVHQEHHAFFLQTNPWRVSSVKKTPNFCLIINPDSLIFSISDEKVFLNEKLMLPPWRYMDFSKG